MLKTFLRERLPVDTVRELRMETARQANSELIDQYLLKRPMDTLAQVETSQGVWRLLLTLLEHKSWSDKHAPLQLLGYVVRVWECWHLQKENAARRLPPIRLMVVYHGWRRWTVPKRFAPLVEDAGAVDHCRLDFVYDVVDICRIPDADLSQNARLMAGLLALKYSRKRSLCEEEAATIARALKGVDADFFVVVFRYIGATFGKVRLSMVLESMSKFAPKEARMARSYLDTLRAEGKAEGKAEGNTAGEAKGKAESILRILEWRFGKVPKASMQRLRRAGAAQLDTWFTQALEANTIKEALADS